MFFQDPSLVEFQKRLESMQEKSNLTSLFGVSKIPESTQMREIIDQVSFKEYSSIFSEYFARLQRGKYLEQFALFPGQYLCPIDGTQYFSSQNIHCDQCLETHHKNGTVTYSHKVLQAAIVHPNLRQVIPLMPEEIRNRDGSSKQDCEQNAAKRFIPRLRQTHPRLGLILLGDGLFSKQPMIETTIANQMHYIFVAKPDDHTYLMDWINTYDNLPSLEITDEKGRIHNYEWALNVPLNGKTDSVLVNFFRYRMYSRDANGKEKNHYRNSWVTDLEVNEMNVELLVRGARSRWKIENECFNTLKNQGYHIEHNYGHGEKFLCYNFYLLTLLSFFFHQIFELTDRLYQDCRKKFGRKGHLWETLRSYLKILVFDSWEDLLNFSFNPDNYNIHHFQIKPP